MGPTRDPSGADGTQVDPVLAPRTLLSGYMKISVKSDGLQLKWFSCISLGTYKHFWLLHQETCCDWNVAHGGVVGSVWGMEQQCQSCHAVWNVRVKWWRPCLASYISTSMINIATLSMYVNTNMKILAGYRAISPAWCFCYLPNTADLDHICIYQR